MSKDGRRRHLTYEERVLWTTVTKSMTPLRDAPMAPADDVAEAKVDAPKLRKAPPLFSKPAKPVKTATPAPYIPPAQKAPPPGLTPLTRRMKRGVARGKQQIDAAL